MISNGITELHTSTDNTFDSKEHPLTINDNLRVRWSAPSIGSDILHSVTSRPLKLADITFTVSPVREQPIKNNIQSYDYVPSSDDIGHKIVACVSWSNNYYTISRCVSNQIAVTE